jgi:hypothetical protein
MMSCLCSNISHVHTLSSNGCQHVLRDEPYILHIPSMIPESRGIFLQIVRLTVGAFSHCDDFMPKIKLDGHALVWQTAVSSGKSLH